MLLVLVHFLDINTKKDLQASQLGLSHISVEERHEEEPDKTSDVMETVFQDKTQTV